MEAVSEHNPLTRLHIEVAYLTGELFLVGDQLSIVSVDNLSVPFFCMLLPSLQHRTLETPLHAVKPENDSEKVHLYNIL